MKARTKNNQIDRLTLFKTLKYSNKTGKFTWKIRPSQAVKIGDSFGTVEQDGYMRGVIRGVRYQVHHLVFLYKTGQYPELYIDHIDHDRSNNRYSNLRQATKSENQCNRVNVAKKSLPKGINKKTPVGKNPYYTACVVLGDKILTKSLSVVYGRDEEDIIEALEAWIRHTRIILHAEFHCHG